MLIRPGSLSLALVVACLPAAVSAQVTTRDLGRASNAESAARYGSSRVAVDESSGVWAHIHRVDVTIWGGGGSSNGRLRVDLSGDGGASFAVDIGDLNPIYTRPARHPSVAIYNPSDSDDPADTRVVWVATTLDPSRSADGHLFGSAAFSTSGGLSSEEQYVFGSATPQTGVASNIAEGASGEFWWSDVAPTGEVSLYLAQLADGAPSTVTRPVTRTLAYEGFGNALSPNVAFAPDGSTGWVAFLGDLEGGASDVLQPVVMSTTDAGATWSTPTQVELADVVIDGTSDTISDALAALDIAASGTPSTTFELDLVVDASGAPHILVVVANASVAYEVDAAHGLLLLDLYTLDGGATFRAHKVADVHSLRGDFGQPDPSEGTFVAQYNFAQIATDAAGEHVFYSWVDSTDPEVAPDNLEPNLHVAALRLEDGETVGPIDVTGGDLVLDGRVLFPSMAPTVASSVDGFSPAIVITDMLTNNQLEPAAFRLIAGAADIAADAFPPVGGEDVGDDTGGDDVGGDDVGGDDVGPDAGDTGADASDAGDAGDDVQSDAADTDDGSDSESDGDPGVDADADTTDEDVREDGFVGDTVSDVADAGDSGSSADSGRPDAPSEDGGGCGCASSSGARPDASALGLVLGLIALRRRRV